jgi:hypothetical protein
MSNKRKEPPTSLPVDLLAVQDKIFALPNKNWTDFTHNERAYKMFNVLKFRGKDAKKNPGELSQISSAKKSWNTWTKEQGHEVPPEVLDYQKAISRGETPLCMQASSSRSKPKAPRKDLLAAPLPPSEAESEKSDNDSQPEGARLLKLKSAAEVAECNLSDVDSEYTEGDPYSGLLGDKDFMEGIDEPFKEIFESSNWDTDEEHPLCTIPIEIDNKTLIFMRDAKKRKAFMEREDPTDELQSVVNWRPEESKQMGKDMYVVKWTSGSYTMEPVYNLPASFVVWFWWDIRHMVGNSAIHKQRQKFLEKNHTRGDGDMMDVGDSVVHNSVSFSPDPEEPVMTYSEIIKQMSSYRKFALGMYECL